MLLPVFDSPLCLRVAAVIVRGSPAASQAMQSTRSSLMDNYDYVMFGRIFKYKDAQSQGQVHRPSAQRPMACML